jgi:hypothetical protein
MERRVTAGGSSVPLETLEALAEDRIRGPERIAALEAVYADPAARAEFEFLREIARERPGPASRSFVWRAAAGLSRCNDRSQRTGCRDHTRGSRASQTFTMTKQWRK